jgi:hypothetical protein
MLGEQKMELLDIEATGICGMQGTARGRQPGVVLNVVDTNRMLLKTRQREEDDRVVWKAVNHSKQIREACPNTANLDAGCCLCDLQTLQPMREHRMGFGSGCE